MAAAPDRVQMTEKFLLSLFERLCVWILRRATLVRPFAQRQVDQATAAIKALGVKEAALDPLDFAGMVAVQKEVFAQKERYLIFSGVLGRLPTNMTMEQKS